MQTQWCLVDRSRSKRSNEDGIEISSKRQRIVPSQLESSDECEDFPKIRGGLARPRPPPLGPPPDRAAKSASRTNPTPPSRPPPTPGSNIRILDSDDDDDDDWRPQQTPQANKNQTATTVKAADTKGALDSDDDDDDDWRPQKTPQANKNQTATTVKAGDTKSASNTTGQPPVLTGTKGASTPTKQPVKATIPPHAGPSSQKQGAGTGTGTGTSRPGGTSSTKATTTKATTTKATTTKATTTKGTTTTTTTKTTTTTPATLPPFTEESEILRLYTQVQNMVVIWVEECLPDTFPQEFPTTRPERYWELCSWCQPLTLGNLMLQDRSWAKYVYESWVWRFFHEQIFQPQSLTWAGDDAPRNQGGAGGAGKTTNDSFANLFDPTKGGWTTGQYQSRLRNRAALMQQLRDSRAMRRNLNSYNNKTGRIVKEMLTAFYPYFSDVYKPIDKPQNILSLIQDTYTLISKARELDEKLRSAGHVYDMILGKTNAVCDITDIPPPAIQRYALEGSSSDPDYLDDEETSLIVVPGLFKFTLEENLYDVDDTVTKTVVRHARALAQADLFALLRA